MRLATWSATLGLLFCFPASASAQFFGPIEALFRKVEGFTFFATAGQLENTDLFIMDDALGQPALRGVGVEAIINLQRPSTDSLKWGVELALGVDFITGFKARNPELDLRGTVRGLPTLSAYVTPPGEWLGFISYFGVNFGFVKLWNVEVFDSEGRIYDLRGDTFQIGGVFGIYHEVGLFAEVGYRNRNFRSVEWGLPPGIDALPRGFPRSADLSMYFASIGLQIAAFLD